MAVPKKRTTKSKRNMRRSHHGLFKAKMQACPKCQTATLPHTVCPNCGTYKGREVIDVTKKLEKQAKKQKEKARESNG